MKYRTIVKVPKVTVKRTVVKVNSPLVSVKPTIVTDRKIVADIQREVKRLPNEKAIENNIKALEILNKLRG